MSTNYTYEMYVEAAEYIKEKIGGEAEIGIILGSGLGMLGKMLEDPIEIPYAEIPNFLRSTVFGHAGKFIFGTLKGRRILCMSGRFHSYEGYTFEQLSLPVRVFKLVGVRALVLTNAAGGVNLDYKPGDIMIINDHICFSGTSPLRGPNIDEFGLRFFDVSHMYSSELIEIAKECAKTCKLRFHEGVYFWMPGPQFETPAEIRAIRTLGGDTVGMSTVTEAVTAAHCELPVLGFSVVTNMAAGILKQPLTHTEVLETANMIETEFSAYMAELLTRI